MGLAALTTRSGPRHGVVPGGSLRLRSSAACAAVVWRVWTRSLMRPVSHTDRLSTGDSAGALGLFGVDANTAPFGSEDATPGSRACVCACSSWQGQAGWPPGRVLVRLTIPLAVFGALFACPAPSGQGLPRLWLLLGGFFFFCFFFLFPFPPLVAPSLCPALRVFRPKVLWALASCRPPPLSFSFPPPPPSVRPVVGCFSCFPASGSLGLGVLFPPPVCFFAPPPLLSLAFPAFRLPWASAPPPLFFVSPSFYAGCAVRGGFVRLGPSGVPLPLFKPALLSPSPRLSTLADDLKRSRVSRLLPKVTCPSPFHCRARTVPIAELQDVPVTETEKTGLSALAPLASVYLPPSGLTAGAGKIGRPIVQANIHRKVPEFDLKNVPEWAEEFAGFLLLTGQSHVEGATKCSLLERSCEKKILQKQVKQTVKTCSTWAEVLRRLEKTFPVYETDLSVRTQIEQLPMLPEFPSAARVSEYVCNLEYLFSYGATEPHLWLTSKIPQRTWDDCRATSERKDRGHSYDELVDLLIQLALERENDSHMEKFLKEHLGRGGTSTPERGEGKGPENPTNANQGGGKGRGNLRAMNEVQPDAGTPEAGSDPRGHLGVTWGVYLCAGKAPLADIILSHPPDLTRCDSVIGLAIPAMGGHIQYRGAAS